MKTIELVYRLIDYGWEVGDLQTKRLFLSNSCCGDDGFSFGDRE